MHIYAHFLYKAILCINVNTSNYFFSEFSQKFNSEMKTQQALFPIILSLLSIQLLVADEVPIQRKMG